MWPEVGAEVALTNGVGLFILTTCLGMWSDEVFSIAAWWWRSGKRFGEPLAQLVEHRTFNPRVAGSIPARLTTDNPRFSGGPFV